MEQMSPRRSDSPSLASLLWTRVKSGAKWFAAGVLSVIGALLWFRGRHRIYPRPVDDPEPHYPPPLPKSKAERDELLKKWKVVK